MLSLPFDTDVPSGAQGAITDYSPGLSGATGANVTWTADGRSGGAYNFSSASSRISVPSPLLNGTGDFTLSAWIRPNSFSAGTQQIMGNMQSDSSPTGVQFSLSGSALLLRAGQQSLQSGASALQAGTWTHVVAVRQNGQASLYVNGTSVQNGSLTGDAGSAGGFSIGNAYPSSSSFVGTIDEPEVFDRALSASEIASLYSGATTVSDRPVLISQG